MADAWPGIGMAAAQFENVNSLRLYPFAEGSSLADRDGVEIPMGAIADLHLAVPCPMRARGPGFSPSGADAPEARLSSLHLSRAMVSACFTSWNGSERGALSVIVPGGSFRPYFPYALRPLAGSSGMGGAVAFGDVELPEIPETHFLDSAVVHPCCVTAVRPPGLRGFFDPRSGESVSGDVGVWFSGYVDAARDGGSISLSLKDGGAAALASECARASGRDVCGATPIESINGVRPDADGNLVLWFH